MNDVGLIAVGEGEYFEGFNIAIGGGLGATHGNEKTYPRRSDIIGFVPKARRLMFVGRLQQYSVITAIVKIVN